MQQLSWPDTLAPVHLNPFTGEDVMMSSNISYLSGGGANTNAGLPAVTAAGSNKEDRVAQWGYQETKDFITIRCDFDKEFGQTKRTKSLWEMISSKMKELGHRRSAEQCKYKWKNLFNRYKAAAVADCGDGETARQFCPFYDELHVVFTDQACVGQKRGRLRENSECFTDEDEFDDNDDGESEGKGRGLSSKKVKRPEAGANDRLRTGTLQDVLEGFLSQQQKMEEEWMDALHRREEDRKQREQEWWLSLEELEQQRLAREEFWKEREEQRRVREEARAQQMDTLFAILISKLAKGG